MGTAALTGSGVAVVTGMIAFGTGFGLAQSASLDIMLRRVPVAHYSAVAAAWNAACDLGWDADAIGMGIAIPTSATPPHSP
jgi:hypothetical protein